MTSKRPWRLGLDVGSVAAKILLLDGDRRVALRRSEACRGRAVPSALELIREAAEEVGGQREVLVALTGVGGVEMASRLPVASIGEVVAAAQGALCDDPAVRGLLDLGGQSSRFVILDGALDGDARVLDFATNGLCAAGSGAFLEQQAARLELDPESLGALAQDAVRGSPIAGRCSVFAKSDMIHLQQKGTPTSEIAYGLCLALARTFVSTIIGSRSVPRPALLVGGGATNPGLVRAFREILGRREGELRSAAHPRFVGALGAALLAKGPALTLERLLTLISDCEEPASRRSSTAALRSLRTAASADAGLTERPETAPAGVIDAYLGLDVGSVSTNLVLIGPESTLIDGIYLKTRGRPVDAIHEGLSELARRFDGGLRILGVGSTGSGRHLAARVVGADLVRNEITAQMVSAAHFVPEVDTIFEIGGQDSKFIAVQNGQLADFEMNKICAAGTGSFLEEQATRLGLSIVDEFSQSALSATGPVDLGTRCTVFMDAELVRAQAAGAGIPDLCAGLAYSVARNYLEKVVAGRAIGRSIVFQGGTASNAAVVAAFRQILDRPIHVHPLNRLSGALGAALLAREEIERQPRPTAFRGFDACASATISSFECHGCENLCQVNRVTAAGRTVHFGDTCEKYSEKDAPTTRTERAFEDLFAAREALFESAIAEASALGSSVQSRPRVGLLRAGLNAELLVFWTAFLARLGYEPVVAPKTSNRLMREYAASVPGEVCLPIKAASVQTQALLAAEPELRVFVPGILDYTDASGEQTHCCLYNQQLADMLRAVHGDRILTAQFGLEDGVVGLLEPALALRGRLGRSLEQLLRALRDGQEAHARFARERERLGRAALESDVDYAVVVLGKPYNTHDPFLNLSLGRLLERLGMHAIPWDMLPLDDVVLDERWESIPWHYNRLQLRAIEAVRRDPRLFAVLVSSYGCGPDAFAVKHIEEALAGVPRLLLEFDEHRGEAGLQTRLEALRDEIEVVLARRRVVASPAASRGEPRDLSGARFLIPNFGPHARIYASALRAGGFGAEVLPEVDETTVRLGEEHASGRECHPHAVLIGELLRFADSGGLRERDVFLSPGAETPCLIRQYADSFRIVARRSGLEMRVFDCTAARLRELVGNANLLHLYEGLFASDVLITLATRLGPYVLDRASFDAAAEEGLLEIARAVQDGSSPARELATASRHAWNAARSGEPGSRPVVGVTGDVYTRIHPIGNARLFSRLEDFGCEVWPSPFFAQMTDLTCRIAMPRDVVRRRLGHAAGAVLARTLAAGARHRMLRGVPEEIVAFAVEPDTEQILELARPYVGAQTNHLVTQSVSKLVDFLRRGAAGAINAAGLNCMVGTVIEGAVPAIRRDFDEAPVISLFYGGSGGVAQQLRLETFVHQVHQRFESGTMGRGGDRFAAGG